MRNRRKLIVRFETVIRLKKSNGRLKKKEKEKMAAATSTVFSPPTKPSFDALTRAHLNDWYRAVENPENHEHLRQLRSTYGASVADLAAWLYAQDQANGKMALKTTKGHASEMAEIYEKMVRFHPIMKALCEMGVPLCVPYVG